MNFEVIKSSDLEWGDRIKSSLIYDFHHTSCFHIIETNEHEKGLLFVAEDENDFIALPLVIREIPNTQYFDASSVYGYAGPVASKEITKLDEELIHFFHDKFLVYCNENNIISVFSRLHPLIKQSSFFANFGSVKELNKTVAIDLTEPIEVQRQHYSRSYKNQINQLKKRKGYSVEKLEIKDIAIFMDIYFETMERVNATNYYFFSNDYLIDLVQNNCFEAIILVAYNTEGVPASAAIYTLTGNIMQYHLGGTKDFALEDAPIKYVMDEARLLASKLNLEYFSLGGGLGGSDDDSLFRFKAGFSKNFFQFSVWNLIVNMEAYEELVKQKDIKASDYPSFFPLYRAK
jgi:hypothetical protein